MGKLIKTYKIQSVIGIFLIVVGAAANVFAGYQLTTFYHILTSQDIRRTILFGYGLVGIWLIAVALQYLAAGYQAYLLKLYKIYLRDRLLEHVSQMSSEEFAKKEGGEYASWLVNDIQMIESNAIAPFFEIIKSVGLVLFAAIALLKLHWILLLGAIVSASALATVPRFFSKRLAELTEKQSRYNETFSQKTYDLFSGFETFFVINKMDKMVEKIRSTYVSVEDQKYAFSVRSAWMGMAMDSVYRIFEFSLQILSSVLVVIGIVNFGVVFAISNLSNRFLNGVTLSLYNYTIVKSAGALFGKLEKVEEPKQLVGEKKPDCPIIQDNIETKEIVIRYESKNVPIGKDYRFEVGKKYALVGESGCGKTSLVRTIIGLKNQYSGEILLDGKERQQYDVQSVLSQFCYISQDIYLFTDSLRFNLTLGESFRDEDLYDVLSQVNLIDFALGTPKGLDAVISNQQNNISGGQRQRLGIARALLQKKKMFIVDEGTSALDKKNAQLIENLLLNNPEYTVLFITHHLAEHNSRINKVYRL